jgi:hypothetical protein
VIFQTAAELESRHRNFLLNAPLTGGNSFGPSFCGAIIDYDQLGRYPETWSKKDWDEVELALKKGGREAFNAANPLLDQQATSPEQRKQVKQISRGRLSRVC